MTIDQVVRVVQVSYPQVYLACHTRHQRKRSTDHRLSPRDAAILAHLDETRPVSPSRLATHLNVARSTVSEAIKRLTDLGFVVRGNAGDDGRRSGVMLSSKGASAIRDTSVLETPQLQAALAFATAKERLSIAIGMANLARACRRLSEHRSES